MKVSLRWLQTLIDVPVTDPEKLAEIFANLGHEVEGYEILTPAFTGVVVGRVETIRLHPDADKVRLCMVTTGGPAEEIVCGAWNFDEGDVVPVAVPGAVLGEDFLITQRDIRGVTSNGMICSSKELRLGDDHDGIMVLDPSLEIGSLFADHIELPDVVFDLSITPNRPDAMSMLGVARDLAAFWSRSISLPEVVIEESSEKTSVSVRIDDEIGCYRFVAREVSGISIGPSPLWMQQRLAKSGVRAINNVVDVSNYVMLELGQPTHAFDFATVANGEIVVRRASEGEPLTTLDEVERTLTTEDLVVADAERASSLAGTMGGANSEVAPETNHVLVEAASWDPATVLHMSRRHQLRSEASARFESNVDPNLPVLAANRVCQLITATAGGQVLSGIIDVYPTEITPWELELPLAEIERILGLAFSTEEAGGLLARLGMGVEGIDPLVVTVPTYRPDLERPIDLIEEIARLHGFDNFPQSVAVGRGGGLTVEQTRLRSLREALRSVGLSEAHTFSFHGHEELEMMGLPVEDIRRDGIEVKNPLREEESLLRTTLLPGLLKAARYNMGHGVDNVALFEIGKVFFQQESPELGTVPHQPDQMAFIVVGGHGTQDLSQLSRPVDVYTGTAIWEAVCRQMGQSFDLHPGELPALHPGRGAEVFLSGHLVGFVGELHPRVARSFGLDGRVVVGEFNLTQIVVDPGAWKLKEPSVFPSTEFDLSFEVPDEVSARKLWATTAHAAGDLLESAVVFDEYRSEKLGTDRRGLALRYILRSIDQTLTADDVAPVRAAMIEAGTVLGAELRT